MPRRLRPPGFHRLGMSHLAAAGALSPVAICFAHIGRGTRPVAVLRDLRLFASIGAGYGCVLDP